MKKKSANMFLVSTSAAVGFGARLHSSTENVVLTQDQATQIFELSAKKYEYSPSLVHVKTGTKVQLKITATDDDHGFKIALSPDGDQPSSNPGLVFDSPQDCWQLKKGETTRIEFMARTPGTYLFKCCHTCGLGHRGMQAQIIVDPPAL